jgi:PEP-CTERM motif
VLKVIDTRKSNTPVHVGKHPRLPFALCKNHWTPSGSILTPIGRHETRHEAEVAMMSIVRRPYRTVMVAAIALAASHGASAATINVTDQWFSLSGPAANDLQQAPPNFVNGSALDNGEPIISNGSAFDDTTNSSGQVALDWWQTGNGVNTISGPTPITTTSGSTFAVNSNAASLNPGNYSEVETISFTNALSGAQPLTLQSDGDVVMFLNGSEILSEQDTDANYFASIGEALVSGTNTLQVFAAWKSNQSPQLIVDPTFTSSAPATPEPSTWAMIGIGGAFLGWTAYRRKRSPLQQALAAADEDIVTIPLSRLTEARRNLVIGRNQGARNVTLAILGCTLASLGIGACGLWYSATSATEAAAAPATYTVTLDR